MKFIIAIITALILNLSVYAQSPAGTWKGLLEIPGVNLPLVVHIKAGDSLLSATLDSPSQGAFGIKVDTALFLNNELSLTINSIKCKYQGKLVGTDSIAGVFSQLGNSVPLGLSKSKDSITAPLNRPQTPRPKFNYRIEDVTIKNEFEGNLLAGTLTTPFNKKDIPVVVMITGSGSQDRDETLFEHKPFLVIADYFTKNGIGVLRMDDRGIGGSQAGKKGATSADFATDINSAVNYLSKRGYKKIGLVGHSEGGMIAPMVATENNKVKFLILMAGPGIPIDQLMLLQTSAVAKSMGETDAQINKTVEQTSSLYNFIKSYNGSDLKNAITAKAETILSENPSYTAEQRKQIAENQAAQLSSPWFQYFLKFNPDTYLANIRTPVLAINGSKDVQVIAKENLDGIRQSLAKANNKNFEVKEFEGLNHLFQKAKTGAIGEYATIEQTIAPEVLVFMKDWILKNL